MFYRKPAYSARRSRFARLEPLEDRRLLAAFELSSLLAENGGTGADGFVAVGPDQSASQYLAVALAGDVNGDGNVDFLFGDSGFNTVDQKGSRNQERYEGAVFVVFGHGTDDLPEIDLESLDGTNGFAIHGNPDEILPRSVAINNALPYAAGDVNGDGLDDLVVVYGNARDSEELTRGRAYVLYGRTDFPQTVELKSLLPEYGGGGDQGFVLTGDNEANLHGAVASARGDVNGDGYSDLVVGSYAVGENGVYSGHAAVLLGGSSIPAEVLVADLNGTNGFRITGSGSGERLGFSVSIDGDLNNDGIDDIVLGAPRGTPEAGTPDERVEAGQVLVLFGNTDYAASVNADGVLDAAAIMLGNGDPAVGFVVNGIYGTNNANTLEQLAPNGIADLQHIVAGDGTRGFIIHGVQAGDLLGGQHAANGRRGNTLSFGQGDDGASYLALSQSAGINRAYVVRGGPDIIPPPPPPSFSIDDVDLAEGDSGTATATFTVTRQGDTSGTDTVDFATADDTATLADDDYLETSGTLAFDPGVVSLTIEVPVVGDTIQEGSETFFVHLSNPSVNASLGDPLGVGTILEDDAPAYSNAIYVSDIHDVFETRNRGRHTDHRVVVDVLADDGDGIPDPDDFAIAGVYVVVDLFDANGDLVTQLSGTTNEDGTFRSDWIKGLSSGEYHAQVVDLILTDFVWDPTLDLEEDQLLTV